jgi:hypothetical protein
MRGGKGRVALLTLAVLALAPPPSAAADEAEALYDPTRVAEIDLSIPQASRDALAVTPDEYQDATFTLRLGDQTYGPLAVGVRLKGDITFRTLERKAAFKVKFAHSVKGQKVLGLKTLTLNNMVGDNSQIHEALAYEAFRTAGVAAPRTGYAYVAVDGQEYGLYMNLETLDDVSLPRWFASTGHLYEGDHAIDVVPGDAGEFEVDEGVEDDRTDLEALIAAVAGSGPFGGRLSTLADTDEFVRMWAVERYIGQFDGYSSFKHFNQPSNYYLHSDEQGRFSMLPWSTDGAWVLAFRFDTEGGGVMFNQCLADPGCLARYREEVRKLPGLLTGLDARAQQIAGAIAPWVDRDPRKELSTQDIARGQQMTRNFMAARPGAARAWLAPPRGEPASGPKGPAAPGAQPLPGRLALRLSLRRRHRSVPRVIRLRTGCTTACRVRARLVLARRVLGRVSRGSLTTRTRVLRLRLSRGVRRSLARRRSARLVVEVRATDALGRSVRARRGVRLAP